MEDSDPLNSRPTEETTIPLAVEKAHDPAGAQLVALLDGDVHLQHMEEVPTDLAAEFANGPPETVVLEVANGLVAEVAKKSSEAVDLEAANHLGVPACPWAPRAGTPVPGPSAAPTVARLSAETELDRTLLRCPAGPPHCRYVDSQMALRSKTAELPASFPVVAQTG